MAKRRLLKFFFTLIAVFFVLGLLAADGRMDAHAARTVGARSLHARAAHRRHACRDATGRCGRPGRRRHPRADRAQLRRRAPQGQERSRIASVLIVPTRLDPRFGGRCRSSATRSSISANPANAPVPISKTGADREYYLATACDRIFLLPAGGLDVKGLASYRCFFAGRSTRSARTPTSSTSATTRPRRTS